MVYTLVDTSGVSLDAEEEVLLKIPYFEALIRVKDYMKTNVSNSNTIQLDSAMQIEVLKHVLRFVTEGMNELVLLVSIPLTFETTAITDLMCLIDFLGLTLNIDMDDIHERLTDVKDQDCFDDHKPNRYLARKTAASIVFGLHQNMFDLTAPKEKSAMFNHILFVVSHYRSFGPRLRLRVYETAKEKCAFIAKQWNQIEEWYRKGDQDDIDETDEYESEEESLYYDSDDDYCGYSSD